MSRSSLSNFPVKSAIGSDHLVAALRTELGAAFYFGATARTFILGTQRLAAFRTEFGALGMRAAGRTERHRLTGEVKVFGKVLVLEPGLHLVNSGLHLRRCQFRLNIGRTLVAQRAFRIPAGFVAYPMRALGALAEVGFGLFNSRTECLVVRRTLNGALNLITVGTRAAQDAAKNASGGA